MNKLAYVVFLYAFNCLNLCAQISENGLPHSLTNSKTNNDLHFITMPEVDTETLILEDEIFDHLASTPWRFGENIDVYLSTENSGHNEILDDGSALWRLGIRSEDAYSINLTFNRFKLPEGAELFIYSPGYDYVLGAFTSYNNQEDGYFATALIPGDSIIVEYREPFNAEFEGELNISTVTHAYRDPFAFVRGFGHSGSCNINVSCPEAENWQDQVNSTVMLLTGSNAFCSGVLINNTAEDFAPYILSADHCYKNPSTVVVWFNWQSSTCSNPGTPPIYNSMSGTTHKARSSETDFWLFELNQPIPEEYNPFFAGWNRTLETQLDELIIGVHHPRGDIKKFSFSENGISESAYLGTSGSGTSHWRIQWSGETTTEPGSSGSPLFDSDGRVIGQLHGGYAACGNTSPDWYGRFGKSWTGNGTNTSMLRPWLDPSHINVPKLRGISYHTNEIEPPFNFKATGLGESEIMLTWNLNSKSDNVIIASSGNNSFGIPSGPYSIGDQLPGGGIIIYIGSDEGYFHQELDVNKTYYYKAWSFDNMLYYSNSTSSQATTFCEPIFDFPFIETFETEKMSSCWQQEIIEGKSLWVINNGNIEGHPHNAFSGNANIVFNAPVGNQTTKLVIPGIQLVPFEYGSLSFYYTNKANELQDTLKIFYRYKKDSEWQQLACFYENIKDWTYTELVIPESLADGQIAFQAHSAGGDGICIDNIKITGYYISEFPPPQNLSVIESKQHYVHLSWESPEVTENSAELRHYKVYRNGNCNGFITTANEFIDTGVPVGTHEYYVTAVYKNPKAESIPSNSVLAEIVAGNTYELVISKYGAGTTFPGPGVYTYNEGAFITIMGYPDEHSYFSHLEENGEIISVSPAQKIMINDDRNITAVFKDVEHSIKLSSLPIGVGNQIGSGSYPHTAKIEISTDSPKGYNFLFWMNEEIIISTRMTFEMEVIENLHLFAVYIPDEHEIALSAYPAEAGFVSGDGITNFGEEHSISAEENNGWEFLYWIEESVIVSWEKEYAFTVENDRSLTAVFSLSEESGTISKIEETISVYPNPASGHLIIETTGISGEVFINLVSSDGQNIYSAKTESGRNFQQKRITTKALKPGLYILKIQHYNGALIEKVIIRE